MGRTTFENYGRFALQDRRATSPVFRYTSQERDERLVVPDVLLKLEIGPDDDVLDIGCGPYGTTVVPLSFLARSVTAVDHEHVLAGLLHRFPGPPFINAKPGNFLDLDFDRTYARILIYAVAHYLESIEEVKEFTLKAARLLPPAGRLLLGDLPNADKKRRFLSTAAGRAFDEQWKRERDREGPSQHPPGWNHDPEMLRSLDDRSISQIIEVLREQGFESYLLPQPTDLPFGHTREDILVVRP